jgi:GMP synthase (glutamine-hydrolysing)
MNTPDTRRASSARNIHETTELRIALLNAAHEAAATRRNFHRELNVELVEFHCPSGELPENFRFDGFVITGSRASVYWDREWIGRLKTWVGEAVRAGVPALGICYGHQLLADVMGGRVDGMGEYEIGYRTVEHDGKSPLLDGINETMTVFTTHSDHVVEKPPGSRVFAKNEYGIHGFRKDRVFAVQFHPEYDMEMARSVTKGKAGALSEARIERVLDGIHAENYRAACDAKRLFDNFLEYALAVRQNSS